jgi:LmbE family N-acetylglucosaminyl deacetylase
VHVARSTRIAVLHLSPHPDDELLGAPATLMALRDAGHRVLNLACSFGSPGDRRRRRRELKAALERARLDWEAMRPPLNISLGDDLEAAQRRLSRAVRALVARDGFDLIVAPTPHDGHHGHEVVGRAATEAIAGLRDPPRLWMWGLWADLPMPTLFVPFAEDRLIEILSGLAEYRGEVDRSDYQSALAGRCRAARVLGVERTFGFGEPKHDGPYGFLRDDPRPYADLLTEVMRIDDEWYACAPRIPDFGNPLASARPDLPIGWWWLEETSIRDRKHRIAAACGRPRPN